MRPSGSPGFAMEIRQRWAGSTTPVTVNQAAGICYIYRGSWVYDVLDLQRFEVTLPSPIILTSLLIIRLHGNSMASGSDLNTS